MFYTTITYVSVCVLMCGGHHDSDRMAVLVTVSKAESILLYHLVGLCIPAKIKISFLRLIHWARVV